MSLANSNIDKEVYNKIHSTGAQPARLYGLPKIHKSKTDPKYRPILSMPNAYCTKLTKYLDSLLKPFIPTEFSIKDTFDFVEKIRQFQLPERNYIISFDVTSLFTNIPLDATIQFICDFIPENALPISKTALSRLLYLSCKDILFSFDEQLFIQHDDMCMGSNLGPTMASFAMHIEQRMNKKLFILSPLCR